VTTGRHLEATFTYSNLVHKIMGDIIFFVAGYFELTAYQKTGTLADTHNKNGFYFMFLGVILGLCGNYIATKKYAIFSNIIPAWTYRIITFAHFTFAYSGLMYAQFVILTGIQTYDRKMGYADNSYLFLIHTIFAAIILITNEILY